jgi:Cullin family
VLTLLLLQLLLILLVLYNGFCVCVQQELDVSQLQATVLLLCFGTVTAFATTEEVAVPLSAIKAKTQIEDGELRRTLKSLACGKVSLKLLLLHFKNTSSMCDSSEKRCRSRRAYFD